jgi:ribosomal protein S27E
MPTKKRTPKKTAQKRRVATKHAPKKPHGRTIILAAATSDHLKGRLRKGASARTGTTIDRIFIDVPCTACGHNELQRLFELIASDATACRSCGAIINLTNEVWCARLGEHTEKYQQLKPM